MSESIAVPAVIMTRLSREVYLDFAKKAKAGLPMIPTDPIAAGFALGVEHVLSKLRDGLVIAGAAE
jgi:hypothetical protein